VYYILNKLIKTSYGSCNKTVIYLLAGKYAVDIDRKNRIASVNNDFLGQYDSIFSI